MNSNNEQLRQTRTDMDFSASALLLVTRWVLVRTRKHLVPSRQV